MTTVYLILKLLVVLHHLCARLHNAVLLYGTTTWCMLALILCHARPNSVELVS